MEKLPNELTNIIKDYIIFKPKDNDELQEAADLWFESKEKSINEIWSYINLGYIINILLKMNALFAYEDDFNEDINNWDVSNVTDMSDMFYEARLFNHPLDLWDYIQRYRYE